MKKWIFLLIFAVFAYNDIKSDMANSDYQVSRYGTFEEEIALDNYIFSTCVLKHKQILLNQGDIYSIRIFNGSSLVVYTNDSNYNSNYDEMYKLSTELETETIDFLGSIDSFLTSSAETLPTDKSLGIEVVLKDSTRDIIKVYLSTGDGKNFLTIDDCDDDFITDKSFVNYLKSIQ